MIISLSSLGLHSCEQYVNFDLMRVTYRLRLVAMGVDCMWNVRRMRFRDSYAFEQMVL